MRRLAIILVCCCAGQLQAQGLLRYDAFDYPVGDLLGQTNPDGTEWTGAYAGVAPDNINVGSGSLAMPLAMGGVGVGNSAEIEFSDSSVATNGNQSGKTVRLGLVPSGPGNEIITGTVYYSLALRIDDITGVNNLNGGTLIGLNNSLGTQTTNPSQITGKIQARVDPLDGTKFNLGIFNFENATAASDSWDEAQYEVGTTYFVVAAYEFVAGAANDVSHLWINPGDLGAAVPPTPTESDTSPPPSGIDYDAVRSILLRQSPAPDLTIDELRVGTTWASVTTVAAEEDDADFNDDNIVDGEDFLIWQRGVSVGTTNADGDADNDLDVDGEDLDVWKTQFGASATASVRAVPEPATLVLAAAAAALAAVRSRVNRTRR